jgi:hypothetical protein
MLPVADGPPGVYSSLTIRLGPDCKVRPDKSENADGRLFPHSQPVTTSNLPIPGDTTLS